MKRTLFIAAILCAAVSASCNKNTIEEPVTPETYTFTCSLPDTKVSIDNEGKTAWVPGDKILIHAGESGDKSITITLTAGDIIDDKTATISFTSEQLAPYVHKTNNVQDYNSTYYFIYPADAAYNGAMYYNTRIVKWDEPVIGGYNNGKTFILRNLCGVAKYFVSGDFDSYELVGANDERVSWTEYQVRLALDSNDNEIFQEKPISDGANMTGVKVASGTVTADGSTENWLVFPGGVNLSNGFTLKFKKDGSTVKTATVKSAFSLSVGDFFNLGNITSHLKDYVAPTSSDHTSSITDATDLSTGGSANCYIISSPGAYKLPVVKGNSNDSAGNVFDVELLWETYNNSETVTANSVIAAVDYDGPDNYIYFETPATLKPGNALIAAKDYEGNIIWSWHIWIPETTIENSKCGDSDGKELMDRNLGALLVTPTDVLSYGLIYQWGRKDPFLGSSGSADAATFGATITRTQGPVSYNTGLKNPTTIYYNNTFPRDWIDSPDETLWGENKTVNDPCPTGYRIPSKDENKLFKTIASEYDATTGVATVNNYTFPLAGYRDKETGAMYKVKERIRFWNYETRTSSAGYGLSYMSYFYNNSNSPSTSEYRSYGCSVRCVVDE